MEEEEIKMFILGISCYYHDAAACIIKDGKIIAAAEEERFTRKKHDNSFPIRAIRCCLHEAGITAEQLDYVSYYEKPLLKFQRMLSQHLQMAPHSFGVFKESLVSWVHKMDVEKKIREELDYKGDISFMEHHASHAASAFFPSPFEEAAIVTVDGVGEWATTTIGVGKRNSVKILKEIHFPHSLGLLYSTFTAYLGFTVNNSEYKVMGLSPYGNPNKYTDHFNKIILLNDDGSFTLDMSYFDFHYKRWMPSKKLCRLFGGQAREKDEEVTQRHKDIAAALQKKTEEVLIHIIKHAKKETGMNNLCLAGGVALNSVANGKILRETEFEDIWIQPAAGDSGNAIGAALLLHHALGNTQRYVQETAYLGPAFSDERIKDFLDTHFVTYTTFKTKKEMVQKVAHLIFDNNVVGWFQGRMEWGPRALGARSILSNPCNPKMQDILNLKVKHRECYDDETQILTMSGWKLFKDLKKNDVVATLNPENKELVYQQIERKTEYKYSGKMVRFKNKRISLVITPEHNVWAKEITNHSSSIYKNQFGFKKAINLVGHENMQIKAIDKWRGKEKKYFFLPEVKREKYSHLHQLRKIKMDWWLEFLGYYLSEGCYCYDKGHHYIYVAQSTKSKHYERIEKCLNKLYTWRYSHGCTSFRLSNKQLFEYVMQFGKSKDKFIPQELLGLSERQLKILFDALMCGDGTYRPKQYKYTTVSKKLADNVQELGLKLGYSVTTSTEISNNSKHNDLYYVRLNKGSKISYVRKNQSHLANYHGKVYCVSVPKYNILCVKRDEKIVFSGNSFRPFAPVVCVDDALTYFECDEPIPLPTDFMLMVYPIRKEWRAKIPAVTHVDGSGRLQTIRREQNPLYYELIKAFGKLSGVPILINTSFNIRGEPIVCTPKDAYWCMMGTGIDYLIMGKYIIKRADNSEDMWDSEAVAGD